eukprot:scaffold10017_cov54-Phaeocystis_antarctica.AAC.2
MAAAGLELASRRRSPCCNLHRTFTLPLTLILTLTLTLSRNPNLTKAPLAVLLPHSRRAEAAQLRQDGATACLTRPLVAKQAAALDRDR